MKTSESIVNLAKALLKAQKNTGAAIKGASNPYFKSKYADLPSVMEVVKQEYNDNGILVLQPPVHRDGKNFIETTLIHAESGEFMTSETEVICSKQNDPQSFGAAQTYARRFGLQSMTFTPAEDDDGNMAAGRTSKTTVSVSVPKELPVPVTNSALKTLTEAQTLADQNSAIENYMSQSTRVTEVKPLKTSNFSKKAKAPKVETPVVAANGPIEAQTQDEGWN